MKQNNESEINEIKPLKASNPNTQQSKEKAKQKLFSKYEKYINILEKLYLEDYDNFILESILKVFERNMRIYEQLYKQIPEIISKIRLETETEILFDIISEIAPEKLRDD